MTKPNFLEDNGRTVLVIPTDCTKLQRLEIDTELEKMEKRDDTMVRRWIEQGRYTITQI